jgi:hypothetical protein
MTDGNAAIMARNAVTDGIAMRWPFNGWEEHNRRYHDIVDMLVNASGKSLEEVFKLVKYDKIKSGKRDGRELSALFLGGTIVKHVDRVWLEANIEYLTEVQVKFYLVEGDRLGYEAFVNAFWSAGTGKFAAAFYQPGNTGKRRKSDTAAVTVGRDKAGLHVTANKYRGQRPGVEGHVTGEVFRKAKRSVLDREDRERENGNARSAFPEVKYQAALRTARRFLSATRSRGIVLTDYFIGVSYVSWEKPLHERGYDVLDPAEERLQARLKDVPGVFPDADTQLGLDLDTD